MLNVVAIFHDSLPVCYIRPTSPSCRGTVFLIIKMIAVQTLICCSDEHLSTLTDCIICIYNYMNVWYVTFGILVSHAHVCIVITQTAGVNKKLTEKRNGKILKYYRVCSATSSSLSYKTTIMC